LRQLAEQSNGKLKATTLGMYSCSFVDINTKMALAMFQNACPGRKKLELANIAKLHPDVLIVTNSYLGMADADTGKAVSKTEYEEGLTRYLDQVKPNVGTVVLLAQPSADKDIQECYSPRVSPSACVSHLKSYWRAQAAASKDVAAKSGVSWIDTTRLYCDQ